MIDEELPPEAARLTSEELEARIFAILESVRPDTAISAMHRLVSLGCGHRTAFMLVVSALEMQESDLETSRVPQE